MCLHSGAALTFIGGRGCLCALARQYKCTKKEDWESAHCIWALALVLAALAGLDIGIFLCGVEGWARFGGEVAVAVYGSFGELLFEVLQQLYEGEFLLRSARVLGMLVVGGHATDVTYSDTVDVMALAVRSHL